MVLLRRELALAWARGGGPLLALGFFAVAAALAFIFGTGSSISDTRSPIASVPDSDRVLNRFSFTNSLKRLLTYLHVSCNSFVTILRTCFATVLPDGPTPRGAVTS